MKIPKFLILNFITKGYLRQVDRFPMSIFNSRIKSMIGDMWFSMAVLMPLFIIIWIPYFIFLSHQIENENFLNYYFLIMLIPWLLLLFAILNKDCLNGMSAGKRTFGFQIVDFNSKETASDFQCMLRNITMFLWPIEAIMILINPKRRIGDFIAKTEVIKVEKRPINSIMDELKNKKLSRKLIISTIIVSILLTLLASGSIFIP